jgi:hypothetical protein
MDSQRKREKTVSHSQVFIVVKKYFNFEKTMEKTKFPVCNETEGNSSGFEGSFNEVVER